MQTPKKSYTSTLQTCNQTILMHKLNNRKAKGKRRPARAVVSVLVVATSLLAIPAVEGFNPGSKTGIIPARKIDQPNRFNSDVVKSKLSYRSHDNAEEQQCQHEKATAELERKRQPVYHVSSFFHTLWTSSKSKRAFEQAELYDSESTEQLVLDNYLESIDRRYKRLHKDDKKNKQDTDGVSSAWHWLTSGKDASCAIEEQRKQEDAIYVLGLAELASKKLLQRHHLPIPKRKQSHESSSIVIDIEGRAIAELMDREMNTQSETAVASTDVSSKPDIARPLLSTACLCIQIVQAVQFAYAARLKFLTGLAKTRVLKGAKVGGKTISSALVTIASLATKNGGAKYAIHFASVFAVSLISVLRPIAKA